MFSVVIFGQELESDKSEGMEEKKNQGIKERKKAGGREALHSNHFSEKTNLSCVRSEEWCVGRRQSTGI